MFSMKKRERPVGQAARKELRRRREAANLSQTAIADRMGANRGIVGWIDGADGGGVMLDTFVQYARALGTEAWRVMRDVEEDLYGERRLQDTGQ
jgi:transcriptional regulator with XRE-family HTH domain